MKTKTRFPYSSVALALTLAVCTPVWAQPVTHDASAEMRQSDMMKGHQNMMKEMKAQDAKLTADIAKMNKAPEDKKLDLMAGILTRMVQQRAAMDAQMGKMQGMMMSPRRMDEKAKPHHSMMNGMSGSAGMNH